MQLWRGEQLGAQRALSQLESRWVAGGAQESEEAPWAGEWVRRSCWDPPYCPGPGPGRPLQQHLSDCAWLGLGGEASGGSLMGQTPCRAPHCPGKLRSRPSTWV